MNEDEKRASTILNVIKCPGHRFDVEDKELCTLFGVWSFKVHAEMDYDDCPFMPQFEIRKQVEKMGCHQCRLTWDPSDYIQACLQTVIHECQELTTAGCYQKYGYTTTNYGNFNLAPKELYRFIHHIDWLSPGKYKQIQENEISYGDIWDVLIEDAVGDTFILDLQCIIYEYFNEHKHLPWEKIDDLVVHSDMIDRDTGLMYWT
jgi:hypothetical protein